MVIYLLLIKNCDGESSFLRNSKRAEVGVSSAKVAK